MPALRSLQRNMKFIYLILCMCCVHALSAQYKADTISVDGVTYARHTVEKGQTLFSLAKYYGTTVDDIVSENPDCAEGIKKGQVLKIRIKSEDPPPVAKVYTYVVKQGDTLFGIAKMFSVSTDEIRKLNYGLPAGIIAGDTINVPDTPPALAAEPIKTDSPHDEIYDIVLMLPFYANYKDTMESRDFRLRDAAIQLYRGAMMASDSLEEQGLNARIHVLDVLDDKNAIVSILRREEMKSADLIIGPLFKDIIPIVSEWSLNNKVHMVVPVQQPNRILLNAANLSKSVPGSTTQWMAIARYVASKYANEQVVLVDSKILDDKKLVEAFKDEWYRIKNDSLRKVVVFNDVASFNLDAKLTGNNCLVVVPTADKKVISAVFKAIGTKEVEVIGLESWDDMEFISTADRNRFHLQFPQNTFIDYEDEIIQHWIEDYRSSFKSEPSTFAFVGFDIMLYYGSGLRAFGKDFPEHFNEIGGNFLATQFNFFRTAKDSGFENSAVNIVRTDNYRLIRIN